MIFSQSQGSVIDTMIKQFHRYAFIIILFSVIINGTGCGGIYRGNQRYKLQPEQPRSLRSESEVKRETMPPPIDIMITIKDWLIQQHRIVGDTYKLGNIRFAGRFLFIGDLVFKLKAEKFPDWYWLVKIPSVEEGIYEIRARPYREYSLNLRPIKAPEQFKVTLRIKDKIVRSHFIVDPDPRWGHFRVSGFKPPILYLKNGQYPNRLWAAKLPKKDGIWTIYVTLIK